MSLSSDVAALLARLESLESEVSMLRSERSALHVQADQLRWAVCVQGNPPAPTEEVPEPPSPAYPTAHANTFHIRFLDVEVVGEQGDKEATLDERSTKAQAVCHSVRGSWVPKGVPIQVMEHDGRSANYTPAPGEAARTTWFFVDAPKFYFGKLEETLSKGEYADVKIWLPGEDGDLYTLADDWWETDCILPAQDRYLLGPSDTVEAGSWVEICWYFSRWVVRQAACGPEEV